ncbi:MAG: hypothetical protein R2828_35825 [Saprospiraceae bacterium]
MKLVIADTSALISLGHVGQIELIEKIFGEFYVAEAVWKELKNYDNPDLHMRWRKNVELNNLFFNP